MRITEGQLRRVIRQEVRALREASMRPPTDDRRLYNTFAVSQLNLDHYADMQNFKQEAPAEFKKFLQLVWKLSDGGKHVHGRDHQGFESHLKDAMAAAGVAPAAPARRANRKPGSGARSGSKKNHMGRRYSDIAKDIVTSFGSGAEPYELADQAIEGTAIFEPGYEHSGMGYGDDTDRMNIIGDESEIIYDLVTALDPDAGAALRQALDDFDGY